MTTIHADRTLDVRGQLCPMPVIETAREIKRMQPGQVLKVIGTDRGSVADLPAWAEDTGNEFISWHEEDGAFVFYIRRTATDDED